MAKTTSSLAAPLASRARYLFQLLRQYELRKLENFGMSRLLDDLQLYAQFARANLGKRLDQCTVLELGYGARPFRAVGMAARGARVYGIDLEQPALCGQRTNYLEIARRNGVERALKSLARSIMYDRKEVKAFEAAVETEFSKSSQAVSFIVGDASTEAAWETIPENLDLVYSEDVFEHIPKNNIGPLLKIMSRRVSSTGIVLVRPNIWTGITGGHFVDWHHANIDRQMNRQRPPWFHLMSGEGEPSVYLNKLRYSDYCELFSRDFEVIEMRNLEYGLGRQYLTEAVRSRIPTGYTNEDLLTNNVLFVMRKKS